MVKTLIELGVTIRPHHGLAGITAEGVELTCVFTGRVVPLAATATVLVTAKLPDEALYLDLLARKADWAEAGIKSVTLIGDANAPAPIAAAVYAGHKYARGLDGPEDTGDVVPFLREVAQRLRELPGLRDVLLIAITGYGQEEDRACSRAAGFDHHLVKPVDPETLSRLLATLGQV